VQNGPLIQAHHVRPKSRFLRSQAPLVPVLAWSSRSRLASPRACAAASPGSRARVGARVLSQSPLSSPGARARVPLAAAAVEVRLCLLLSPSSSPSPVSSPRSEHWAGQSSAAPPCGHGSLLLCLSRTDLTLLAWISLSLALLMAKRSSFDLCGTIGNVV
jgi:hypothetical protein